MDRTPPPFRNVCSKSTRSEEEERKRLDGTRKSEEERGRRGEGARKIEGAMLRRFA